MRSVGKNEQAEVLLSGKIARLESLTPAELCGVWDAACGAPALNVGSALLLRLLAHRIQEKRLGGLPAMVVRELERTAAGPTAGSVPNRVTLTPGARLIREWQGRTKAVLTKEAGFVWEERAYKSLS